MTTSRSKFVKCPFYRMDTKNAIGCFGVTDECGITLRFRTNGLLDRQMHTFCESAYQQCELFQMLWSIYDR